MTRLPLPALFIVAACLAGCGSSSDDDFNLFPSDDGLSSSCTTNVQGCESSEYSCPVADFCYASIEGCSLSEECDR